MLVFLLKKAGAKVSSLLWYIINFSFSTGIFPRRLKLAYIKAIYKKGEIDEARNYRPFSLLSNIGKVFEKVMFERLMSFFKTYSIITDMQNGFIRSKSTIRAVYQAIKKVLNSVNNKNQTLLMCMDLSKAFDSVDHALLCRKL